MEILIPALMVGFKPWSRISFVDLETGMAHAGASVLFLERGSTSFAPNVRILYADTELARYPAPNSIMLLLLSLYFDE